MLGSWRLSSKPDDQRVSQRSRTPSTDTRSRSPHNLDAEETTSAPPAPDPDQAATARPSTQHDAILADLLGPLRLNTQPAEQPPPRQEPPKPPTFSGGGSADGSEPTAGPSTQPPRSATASPASAPEPVYDPYSGSLAGVMLSPTQGRGPARQDSGASFEQTKDDLWAHLARIRGLQSEIAGMHLQMEDMGAGEGKGAKRAAAAAAGGRTRRTTEEWEDPGPEEDQRKADRDAEFASLAETFNSRRTAIDDIMGKLDELSKALTHFHALPTPAMDLQANSTRSNTKDSFAVSPDSPSPSSNTALPTADHQEAIFRESPTSDAPPHPGLS